MVITIQIVFFTSRTAVWHKGREEIERSGKKWKEMKEMKEML
jgi:hypothetical protein